jgi:hypothetical protein
MLHICTYINKHILLHTHILPTPALLSYKTFLPCRPSCCWLKLSAFGVWPFLMTTHETTQRWAVSPLHTSPRQHHQRRPGLLLFFNSIHESCFLPALNGTKETPLCFHAFTYLKQEASCLGFLDCGLDFQTEVILLGTQIWHLLHNLSDMIVHSGLILLELSWQGMRHVVQDFSKMPCIALLGSWSLKKIDTFVLLTQ